MCVQAALSAWIEKAATPKLVSLDKKPVNKKALASIFANNEVPKVIGVLDIESEHLSDFHAKLIKLGEDHSDLHVRVFCLPATCHGPLVQPACCALALTRQLPSRLPVVANRVFVDCERRFRIHPVIPLLLFLCGFHQVGEC